MIERLTYLVRDLSRNDYWDFVAFLHCQGPAALRSRQLVGRHYGLHGLGNRDDSTNLTTTKMMVMMVGTRDTNTVEVTTKMMLVQ